MPKINKRIVAAAIAQNTAYDINDSELRGFGVRILPSGAHSYFVRYRRGGQRRRISLGSQGTLTPEQARSRAVQLLARVGAGEDPAAGRQSGGQITTVADLVERFESEHIAVRLKPTTIKDYRRHLRYDIVPTLGHLQITEITRDDVARFHHKYRHIPYQANRKLATLSKMFSMAELWGLRPDGSNPCRRIKKYPERKRKRYLRGNELAQLGEALRESEHEGLETRSSINLIRLLLYTGCRLSEILTLKWDYVDLENGVLRLPDSKTGEKIVHIGGAAVRCLAGIEQIEDNPWVITGKLPRSHLVSPQRAWQRIRARAGLGDVRIHDLRHTFASVAVSGGQGLPMIGKLLGHTQVQTTAGYAHLFDEPVKQAADDVSASIEAALEGEVTT